VDVTKNIGTILLVEDEIGLRKYVSKVLQRLGYNVLEASGGDAAALLFEEHAASIDLLLTDVIMPGMGGVELSHRLRAICPDVKVLYMTGYDDGSLKERADGAALLRKPFTSEALEREIRRFFQPRHHRVIPL